jgi:lantibiotic modifying enzyme
VLDVVIEIADDVASRLERGTDTSAIGRDPSLATGQAGIALFFAYLGEATQDEQYVTRALHLLEQSVRLGVDSDGGSSLYGGFLGVAWVLAHLGSRGFEIEDHGLNDQIDRALLDLLSRPISLKQFDLVSGLIGMGVYAMERLPRPTAAASLERVVDRLAGLGLPESGGMTWWAPQPGVLPSRRGQIPHVHKDLGVAHGVAGVISFLAGVVHVAATEQLASQLLHEAVSWLLQQQLPPEERAVFPPFVGPDLVPAPGRSAWCYGDPGVAAALSRAAGCTGNREWEEAAIVTALRAANRHDAGVVDAGLCHGSAGLAHVFHSLHRATQEPALEAAARLWLERTLGMRRPRQGIAGFATPSRTQTGEVVWIEDAGFLTGVAGTGLALLAGSNGVEPGWDRLLLLSSRALRVSQPSPTN